MGEPRAGRGLYNCGSQSCGGGVQNHISLELLIARYPRKNNGGLYCLRGSLRRASRPAGAQGGKPLGRHLLYGASHSGSGLNQGRASSQELLLPMSHSAWWIKKRVKGLWMVWKVHWSHAYTYHTHTTQHTAHNTTHNTTHTQENTHNTTHSIRHTSHTQHTTPTQTQHIYNTTHTHNTHKTQTTQHTYNTYTQHTHSLQGQVSNSLAKSWIAHCSSAVVFQLLCFSRSHNNVALGAWRDRISRQLWLQEDVTMEVAPTPTPQDLGTMYAAAHVVLQSKA